MGMFHEAFRKASHGRGWFAPTISNFAAKAIETFAEAHGIDEFSPEIIGSVFLDRDAVIREYDDRYEGVDLFAELFTASLKVGHLQFVYTGLAAEGKPIVAVHVWNRMYIDPDRQLNEVFFITVTGDIWSRVAGSVRMEAVVWWYEEE